MNTSTFCTCENTDCPLHPTRHEKGCSPCIAKNLKLREIPNCFFQQIKNSGSRTGDSFRDFSELVLKWGEKAPL